MHDDPLGLIGLGLLGSALAERFLTAGLTVYCYDIVRDRGDHFVTLGRRHGESTAEVIRACRRTVLSLPTSDVVAALVSEVAGAWRADAVVIDTTTGDPEVTTAV